MPKTGRRALTLLFLVPLLVWAAEPWQDKSPSQWNKKEVDRILRDSPWAKAIATPTTWARTGGEKFGVGTPSTIRIGGGDTRVGAAGGSNDPWDPQNHQGYFLVRWASSKIIRAAKVRAIELRGAKPAKRDLEPSAEALYELELEWDLFARFPIATEDEAAQNSHLKPSGLGVEFRPRRVEYRRGAAGVVTAIVFYFDRKTAGGAPLISEKENRVDFYWGVGPSSIQARFDPQKMVAREEKDF